MATFQFVWNVSFESLPPDTEAEAQGASRIRDFKVAYRERFGIDHSIAGDANDGKHNKVTLRTVSGKPALDPGDGAVYTKTVSNNTELFYEDSTGNEVPLSTGGIAGSSFPSNTELVFLNPAAPPGWRVDPLVQDRMLRIVSDNTGGLFGGNWTISGLTVQGHQLIVSEMPSHSHIYNPIVTGAGPIGGGGGFITGTAATSITGGDQPHSHPITADGTWRPLFCNGLACLKN